MNSSDRISELDSSPSMHDINSSCLNDTGKKATSTGKSKVYKIDIEVSTNKEETTAMRALFQILDVKIGSSSNKKMNKNKNYEFEEQEKFLTA